MYFWDSSLSYFATKSRRTAVGQLYLAHPKTKTLIRTIRYDEPAPNNHDHPKGEEEEEEEEEDASSGFSLFTKQSSSFLFGVASAPFSVFVR